jgi:hypothetical protein
LQEIESIAAIIFANLHLVLPQCTFAEDGPTTTRTSEGVVECTFPFSEPDEVDRELRISFNKGMCYAFHVILQVVDGRKNLMPAKKQKTIPA